MIIEKCTTCNVNPVVELNDANQKKFSCKQCGKNADGEFVKAPKTAAGQWNEVNE